MPQIEPSLVVAFAHALPDLLALGADRVLLRIPAGDPYLATQRDDRSAVDHGLHELVLGDVVRQPLVVSVISGAEVLLDALVLQDASPETRCPLRRHLGILTPRPSASGLSSGPVRRASWPASRAVRPAVAAPSPRAGRGRRGRDPAARPVRRTRRPPRSLPPAGRSPSRRTRRRC